MLDWEGRGGVKVRIAMEEPRVLLENGQELQGDKCLENSLLLMRCRSLEQYKDNYELLCQQLNGLNEKVGIQLHTHEQETKAYKEQIETLQLMNKSLTEKLVDYEAKLLAQQSVSKKDQTHVKSIEKQLKDTAILMHQQEAKHKRKEEKLQEEVRELKQKVQKHLDDIETLGVVQVKYVKCKKYLKHVYGKLKDKDSKHMQSQQKLRLLKQMINELSKDKKKLKVHLDKENSNFNRLQTKYENQKEKIEQNSLHDSYMKKLIDEKTHESEMYRKEVTILNESNGRMQQSYTTLYHDMQEAQRELQKAKLTILQKDKEMFELQKNIQHLQVMTKRHLEEVTCAKKAIPLLKPPTLRPNAFKRNKEESWTSLQNNPNVRELEAKLNLVSKSIRELKCELASAHQLDDRGNKKIVVTLNGKLDAVETSLAHIRRDQMKSFERVGKVEYARSKMQDERRTLQEAIKKELKQGSILTETHRSTSKMPQANE